VSGSDLRAGVERLAAYVKKLRKETVVEPLKKALAARSLFFRPGKQKVARKRTLGKPGSAM
jgi:hypothetical protein